MTVPVGTDRRSMSLSSAPSSAKADTTDVRASTLAAPAIPSPSPLGWGDALGIVAGVALILAISAVFGYGRIFWEDEMLGWMLLHDPSWHHMLRAWKLGADGGGFAFYLTGRAWFSLFGASELSFRMYSGACFAGAFATIWLVTRRFYTLGITAFALANTFFFSPPLVLHMAEGRFYGLLTLSTALAIALAVLPPRTRFLTPTRLCLLTFLTHALLTTSHLLGVVYSAFLLAATVAIDRSEHRLRLPLYLSIAASWLLLLPERAAILASANVGKPHFWTTQPTLRRFVGAYSAFGAEIAIVLLLLGIAVCLWLWIDRARATQRARLAYRARRPIFFITLALLLVPLAFFIEGFVGPALFISRYLLPVAIAQVMLTAEALTLVRWQALLPLSVRQSPRWTHLQRPLHVLGPALFVLGLLFWVFGYLRPLALGQINYTDALSAALPKGIPILCEDAWSFTEIIGRQHASGVLYTYLLDWPQSISSDAPRLEVTQYHLMQNWRKAGYFAGSIVDRDPFLKQHTQFFILQTQPSTPTGQPPEIGNPLIERFMHDPAYMVHPYASLARHGFTETVWRVCRGACAPLGMAK